MKTHIWNEVAPFNTKVNFVDTNNVVLGYDLQQDYCEDAYWFISTSEKDHNDTNTLYDHKNVEELDLEGYCFDHNYYQILSDKEDQEEFFTQSAIFKLVGSKELNLPDLFVILSNTHNGYY